MSFDDNHCGDYCELCEADAQAEEHTDRMARRMKEDADIARLNARMEGLE